MTQLDDIRAGKVALAHALTQLGTLGNALDRSEQTYVDPKPAVLSQMWQYARRYHKDHDFDPKCPWLKTEFGCYRCCERCNYATHMCGGCGDALTHLDHDIKTLVPHDCLLEDTDEESRFFNLKERP